ncbi:MAG: hypothetical protein ACJATY_003191 [Spirosomataceae bacterium]|jgi:hypothetical protein
MSDGDFTDLSRLISEASLNKILYTYHITFVLGEKKRSSNRRIMQAFPSVRRLSVAIS